MKRKPILLLCVLLIVSAAGCNQIEEIQEGIVQTQENLSLTNEIIANIKTELAENQTLGDAEKAVLNVKLDEALAIKTAIDTQLTELKEALELAKGQGVGGQMEVGGDFVQRLSNVLPPPLNGIGALIGILLTSVGGGIAKRQATKRKATESALKDVVKGVDELLSNGIITNVEMAKKTLGGAQDKATSEIVRKIKSGG